MNNNDYYREQDRLERLRLADERHAINLDQDRYERNTLANDRIDQQERLHQIERQRLVKQREIELMQQRGQLFRQATTGNSKRNIPRKDFAGMLEYAVERDDIAAIETICNSGRLGDDCYDLISMLSYARSTRRIDLHEVRILAAGCYDRKGALDPAGSSAFRFVGRRDVHKFTAPAYALMSDFVAAYRADLAIELSGR